MARRLLVLLVPLSLLAACSHDSPAVSTSTTAGTSTPSSSTTAAPGSTSTTTPAGPGIALTGPVGSGTVAYSLEPTRSELCYRISVTGIGKPTAAHLRRSSGEVVLDLQPPPAEGTINTCAAADSILMEEMQSQPSDYVIDVQAPTGTLRAVLS